MFVWEINDNATPSYLVPIDSNECHKSAKFEKMDDVCSIDYVIKDLLAKNRLTENPVKLKKNAGTIPSTVAVLWHQTS